LYDALQQPAVQPACGKRDAPAFIGGVDGRPSRASIDVFSIRGDSVVVRAGKDDLEKLQIFDREGGSGASQIAPPPGRPRRLGLLRFIFSASPFIVSTVHSPVA
jgi:hypothetical protein